MLERLRSPGAGASWMGVARRTVERARLDHITTLASGVAFFVVLAILPGLAAVVWAVSLVADPASVQQAVDGLTGVLPDEAVEILKGHVAQVREEEDTGALDWLGIPFLGLAILLWSANRGTMALLHALNAIYEQEETRGTIAFTAVSLLFTLGTILLMTLAIGALLVLPLALQVLDPGGTQGVWVRLLRWPLLLAVMTGALAVVYRWGPSRDRASWSSVGIASVFAALIWLAGSLAFSWYTSRFGDLSALYGSLGTVAGFMIWTWVSAVAVLAGAELDAAILRARHDPRREGA